METLSQAPLIEVIFELRWGKVVKKNQENSIEFHFSNDNLSLFEGQFNSLVKEIGFCEVENVNPLFPNPIPHTIKHRYRIKKDQWPCYQTGLGIFTVNQVNDGYDWSSFRNDVQKGLEILGKTNSINVEESPLIGAELRYQDGFFLEKDETPLSFLKNKMSIDYSIPETIFEIDGIDSEVKGNKIEFQIGITKPRGVLIFSLTQALINGQPGFVMDTIVRSSDKSSPSFGVDSLLEWINNAHKIQRNVFRTVIEPSYRGNI